MKHAQFLDETCRRLTEQRKKLLLPSKVKLFGGKQFTGKSIRPFNLSGERVRPPKCDPLVLPPSPSSPSSSLRSCPMFRSHFPSLFLFLYRLFCFASFYFYFISLVQGHSLSPFASALETLQKQLGSLLSFLLFFF